MEEKMSSFILNDKVRVIGQDYYNDSYDIIIDIVEGKEPYMIEDGCTYKQNELTEYIPNLYNKTKEEISAYMTMNNIVRLASTLF